MTPGLGSYRSSPRRGRRLQALGRLIEAYPGIPRRGRAGVVATPLCAFDADLPAKQPHLVQAVVDPVQADLDASRTGPRVPPNCYEEPLFMYDRQKGLLLELGCEVLPCVGGDGEHDPVTILGVADGHPAVGQERALHARAVAG